MALTWNFLTVLQLENYFASLKNPKLRVSCCSSLVPLWIFNNDIFHARVMSDGHISGRTRGSSAAPAERYKRQ